MGRVGIHHQKPHDNIDIFGQQVPKTHDNIDILGPGGQGGQGGPGGARGADFRARNRRIFGGKGQKGLPGGLPGGLKAEYGFPPKPPVKV